MMMVLHRRLRPATIQIDGLSCDIPGMFRTEESAEAPNSCGIPGLPAGILTTRSDGRISRLVEHAHDCHLLR